MMGWNPKCGCSSVKRLMLYIEEKKIVDKPHHCCFEDIFKQREISNNIQLYDTIIVVRNPYLRIVSGFLNKYPCRKFREKSIWNEKPLTFEMFVDELITNKFKNIDYHHFSHQIDSNFKPNILKKSKTFTIYDIENIDYKYIEELINMKLPEELILPYNTNAKKYNKNNKNNKNNKIQDKQLFSINIDDLYKYEIDYRYFYNIDIKKKLSVFYKKDFEMLKYYGFDYDIEI